MAFTPHYFTYCCTDDINVRKDRVQQFRALLEKENELRGLGGINFHHDTIANQRRSFDSALICLLSKIKPGDNLLLMDINDLSANKYDRDDVISFLLNKGVNVIIVYPTTFCI